ncbi:PREDICTED: uncharacterized protein LOC107604277 [Ficedula albicollis]|uniref:uncharacterized protein LOC107604277 n=1 Tax=Ficedula albicollis TaxID=59894 RepID=UPI0007AD8FFB|nr:PREDICTED: uncharacterized protein LOC107604277 [Ficedula albicollis]
MSFDMFINTGRRILEEKQIDNLQLADADPLKWASIDQLMGSGRFRDPQLQAALPPRILGQSKAAALEAFAALPQIGKPRYPYLKITQENEPFIRFIDRVRDALEAAPNLSEDAKAVMLTEIARQNANTVCRQIITMQPGNATLTQLVEACAEAPLARTVTLADDQVHILETIEKGPIGYGLAGQVLGRSSISSQGIFVLPGIIDADYTGIIKIMVKVFKPPVTIPTGSKTAQLVPFQPMVLKAEEKKREADGFGSTGNNLALTVQKLTLDRPTIELRLNHPSGEMLIDDKGQMYIVYLYDTGSDVTIIPQAFWPSNWLLTEQEGVTGIGGHAKTYQAGDFCCFTTKDGRQAHVKPYVMNTALWVAGRDILP